MFSSRGRGGPMRPTPANVQCQKCLKRDIERHYSYECKAATQERPYAPRPSRSQQLRNPKLVPKLTNDTLNPLEQKKGVADEQLAKREAERARKRALEEQDEELIRNDAKRRKSPTFEPDSAVSAPRGMTTGRESPRSMRDESPHSSRSWSQSRSRSRSISRSHSRSRSRSPRPDLRHPHPADRSRFIARDSRSPSAEQREPRDRDRHSPPQNSADDRLARRRRRYSSISVASRDSRARLRDLSRSPGANVRRNSVLSQTDGQSQRNGPSSRGSGGHEETRRDNEPRERSLSPFSQRLALTRAMGPARG